MRMAEKDRTPYKPKKDDWDRVLDNYKTQKEKGTVSLSENKKEKETLDKVIAFRVTPSQYEKLMKRFGDPSGIRETLLPELSENLENINIRENSGDLIALDD